MPRIADEIQTTLVTDLSAVDYTLSVVDLVRAAEDAPTDPSKELAAHSARPGMAGAVAGETKRVGTKTAVLGMTNKQPPSLMLRKRVVGAGGAARHVTLLFPVLDPDLLLRLFTEVHPGDEVEATVVNVWREDGYTTHLESFCKVLAEEAPATKDLAAQTA